MRLKDYPRPLNDNGRGIHWVPTPITHWDKRWDWERWKTFLLEANIKWVKVLEDGSGSKSNLQLIKRLVGLNIMPVVRFYIAEAYPYPVPVGAINYAKELTNYGVVYFEFGNEPDLFHLEWGEPAPPYPEWEHLVVERYISAWDAMEVHKTGAIPLFDAYGPGGRGNPFQYFVDLGRTDVFEQMAIAVHNYCLGRPALYPNDSVNQRGREWLKEEYDQIPLYEDWGPALNKTPQDFIWEATLKYVNTKIRESVKPEASIMEDSTGFRAFEYLRNLFVEAAGFEVPVIMTEGGYNPLQVAPLDARYPKPGAKRHRDLTIHILDEYKYPSYYFGNAGMWFIGASEFGHSAAAYEHQGPLFTHTLDTLFNLDGELPIVQYMRDNGGRLLANGPLPNNWEVLQPHESLNGRIIGDTVPLVLPSAQVSFYEGNEKFWYVSSIDHKNDGQGYVYFRCYSDKEGGFLEGVNIQMQDPWNNVYTASTKAEIDNWWGNLSFNGLQAGQLSLKVLGYPSEIVLNLGNGQVDETNKPSNHYVEFMLVDKYPEIEPPPIDPPTVDRGGYLEILKNGKVISVVPSNNWKE